MSANNTDSLSDGAATGGKPSTGQKLKGAAKVVHGIGENWRGHALDVLDGGAHARQRPEVERGRIEVEQGMAMVSGDPLPPTNQSTQHGASTASYGGDVGADQAYNGGVAGAGTTMPINAAVGAGTGGAYPPAGYEASAGYSGNARYGAGETAMAGGRNDREFQAGNNAYAAQGGAGPAPDHTAAGPGTGVASSGIQRLP